MPRLTQSVPKYRKHKSSGQAIVELSGKQYYLGPHGTKTSKVEYDRLIGEWLQRGRQPNPSEQVGSELSVVELIAKYLTWANGYYVKNGEPTSEVQCIGLSLRIVRKLYGATACVDFGPVALKAVRQRMIDDGLSRKLINQRIGRVKRMFKWGASDELIPPSIHEALRTVEGLRRGRSEARETESVRPIDVAIVDQTIQHMPEVVADMVRLQRLMGCRPDEICMIRPKDIDRQDAVWKYEPMQHKTQHHGKERVIAIGPIAQGILLKYLAREPAMFCFRPCDSEAKRRAAQHMARKTPVSCGNRPGTNRKQKPKWTAGERYGVDSYRRAISRACKLAYPHPTLSAKKKSELKPEEREELKQWDKQNLWAPNRLRHSRATEVRKKFGLAAVQVVLGHSHASTSEIYAERDQQLAAEVALATG